MKVEMFRVPQAGPGWEEFRNGCVEIRGVEYGKRALEEETAGNSML
jgi:hypothetical protein